MITTQSTDTAYAVGSEIEAICKPCGDQDRMHVIVSLKTKKDTDIEVPNRVRCLTCNHEHTYRPTAAAKEKQKADAAAERKRIAEEKKARKAKLARSAGRGEILSFDVLSSGRNLSNPKLYSRTEKYEKEDIIEHPKFGIGIVAAVRGSNKIDVSFNTTGAHTLVHNCLLPNKV